MLKSKKRKNGFRSLVGDRPCKQPLPKRALEEGKKRSKRQSTYFLPWVSRKSNKLLPLFLQAILIHFYFVADSNGFLVRSIFLPICNNLSWKLRTMPLFCKKMFLRKQTIPIWVWFFAQLGFHFAKKNVPKSVQCIG